MKSRMRERRTYGSVRGLWREPLVYSTKLFVVMSFLSRHNEFLLNVIITRVKKNVSF